MRDFSYILGQTDHRPFDLPQKPWAFYQQWHETLFLHWKIDAGEISGRLPRGLEPQLFEGSAWVSLVVFSVRDMRLRLLPKLVVMPAFYESNLRTYVTCKGKPGIWFFSIDTNSWLAVGGARVAMGLEYRKARIAHAANHYALNDDGKLSATFSLGKEKELKTPLDMWLTERYCLFDLQHKELFRFNVHHAPWRLREIGHLRLDMAGAPAPLPHRDPDLCHFSHLQEALLWTKERL